MADISDVEQSVADTISRTLYPQGVTNGSIIGTTCKVYRGWPNAAALNADLAAEVVNITVTSDNDSGKVTTRYLDQGETAQGNCPVNIQTRNCAIILSGVPHPGVAVGVLIDSIPFVCRVDEADSLELIAAKLAVLINVQRPAIVQGRIITVPGARVMFARAVVDGTYVFESRRQEKCIRVVLWCPSPAIRDSVASAVDGYMSQMRFLEVGDGTFANINYKNTLTYDQSQNALLYRRDLEYTVEYPTLVAVPVPAMLFGAAGVNGATLFG